MIYGPTRRGLLPRRCVMHFLDGSQSYGVPITLQLINRARKLSLYYPYQLSRCRCDGRFSYAIWTSLPVENTCFMSRDKYVSNRGLQSVEEAFSSFTRCWVFNFLVGRPIYKKPRNNHDVYTWSWMIPGQLWWFVDCRIRVRCRILVILFPLWIEPRAFDGRILSRCLESRNYL